MFHIEIKEKCGWIIGGPKGMLPLPSEIIGGGGLGPCPPPPPPLFLRLCILRMFTSDGSACSPRCIQSDCAASLFCTRPQLILPYSLIIHPSMRLSSQHPRYLKLFFFLSSLSHDKAFNHSLNWAKLASFSLFTP